MASSLEKWKRENPEDNFFFRSYELNSYSNDIDTHNEGVDSDENEEEDITMDEQSLKHSLLFVHQSAWQRRLLAKYGNNLCLLDATYMYKTTNMPYLYSSLW